MSTTAAEEVFFGGFYTFLSSSSRTDLDKNIWLII